MSAPHHLPQRHLNLMSHPRQTSQFGVRPSIADRFSQLLSEIESFLLACTYEEMCSFWNAIANLRQYLQKDTNSSEVPQFLNGRRKQRDFCRILEVLADLPYPQLHLSTHLAARTGDLRQPQQTSFVYPHLVIQR
ncbi:hypothetical protein APA_769 [Pseudanabaena sp. lw0831]|uniref:hypothetical protein n=1 Tax=Pseudanabaena sp. lw0831 TaxID=1357935 RepID=UPI001916B135|nr:hypothetical protein [Pseudanabaena sp. lw0831]GBO52968.1 hypothetical protein APA_769 [Pseudanabaena sp. lw0831]